MEGLYRISSNKKLNQLNNRYRLMMIFDILAIWISYYYHFLIISWAITYSVIILSIFSFIKAVCNFILYYCYQSCFNMTIFFVSCFTYKILVFPKRRSFLILYPVIVSRFLYLYFNNIILMNSSGFNFWYAVTISLFMFHLYLSLF